jgi:(E)-4-hydroxy-3-methylbut-2-enyl-diphosphate synthase
MSGYKTYSEDLFNYKRFKTREVKIGDLLLGGNQPIRIQSMTTTDSMDTAATVAQSIRMIEKGCELVRITAPSIKEAQNLKNIKDELRKSGFSTPLVADIHFTPNAAEIAARIVEKVRINPGNFIDKKKFELLEYTDSDYQEELDKIRAKFTPLVNICKEYGTALRIGTNHGSLSDRILSRYGDTPFGMVESAMEFLTIARDLNYHQIVLSMKASNTHVMVEAYRLLVSRMMEEGMNYPLHLGVTEAGDGEDGRIKSAVGIGALLEDGLGDTIRVSLTEDPEFEIPVAQALVAHYAQREKHEPIKPLDEKIVLTNYSPFEHVKRTTLAVKNIGGTNVPVVFADLSNKSSIQASTLFAAGYAYSVPTDKWNLNDFACDYVFAGYNKIDFEIPGTLGMVYQASTWKEEKHKTQTYPLFDSSQYFTEKANGQIHPELNFVQVELGNFNEAFIQQIEKENHVVLVADVHHKHAMALFRKFFLLLKEANCQLPVIIKNNYAGINEEQFQLYASADTGTLFVDGFGDGLWFSTETSLPTNVVNKTIFGILQASRTRISKTEYISCPSCGRTLFDLQETTQKIRKQTDHLKGIKIGIMGCIVNGPGEMADADYGYVGTGVGKITLYKGKEVVKRNIVSEEAVDALIDLIKDHGDWVEPHSVQ